MCRSRVTRAQSSRAPDGRASNSEGSLTEPSLSCAEADPLAQECFLRLRVHVWEALGSRSRAVGEEVDVLPARDVVVVDEAVVPVGGPDASAGRVVVPELLRVREVGTTTRPAEASGPP